MTLKYSITAAMTLFFIQFGLRGESSYSVLDGDTLARLSGKNGYTIAYRGDCADYVAGGLTVIWSRCNGWPDGTVCVRCGTGTQGEFNSVAPGSPLGSYKVMPDGTTKTCTILNKYVGTCINDLCTNLIQVYDDEDEPIKCIFTPDIYKSQ